MHGNLGRLRLLKTCRTRVLWCDLSNGQVLLITLSRLQRVMTLLYSLSRRPLSPVSTLISSELVQMLLPLETRLCMARLLDDLLLTMVLALATPVETYPKLIGILRYIRLRVVVMWLSRRAADTPWIIGFR